jgi:hypothetical protein
MQNAPLSAATAGHGVLTGVVTDRTGAVVPHATITATSEATAQSISVKTDMAGKFSLSGLEPGVYTVQAQMPGFQLQRISGIRLGASAGVVQNFSLEVGAAAETVAVEASNSTLQTESANLDATIDSMKVAEKHTTVFELTTDTGEVWVSSDGRHWKRK